MADVPSGTVTFLFSDIEGSTELAQRAPAALPALLARQRTLVRGAIEAHGGHIFNVVGDAFCVAFRTAPDAVAAAVDAQRTLHDEPWEPAPVRVRMGIHTGAAEAVTRDGTPDYEGYAALARVHRVMSAAHGGQVLASNAAAELLRDALPAGVSLRDLGEHALKGLALPERLWQVAAPGLPQEFPPLQATGAVPGNLPRALNRFIGRARELREVKERLAEARLLTLLGPGGTGKTRLALQAAADLRADYQDRVYFVDLAASRDIGAVLAAIARTLGLRETGGQPLLATLKAQIGGQRMLLLLDNFEQVTVAAPAVAELLGDCPELRVLVTSREALRVRVEAVYHVPPLALPAVPPKPPSLEDAAQAEAVQLFVERAQAVRPDFRLTRENAAAVVEICARLDGLPLAIELATARLSVFTPQALAERLGNRLKLLRGGARDLPERQQTLHATIDWSYELLDAGEQDIFKLLALFAGATLPAVEAVAARLGVPRIAASDAPETVGSLVDKSLLRQMPGAGGEARFVMLETIREFAGVRLAEEPALHADARRAHAVYYADFAGQQWERLSGEGREAALDALAIEVENLKDAWRTWAGESNLEQLHRLADSLWVLYDARGWYHESVELTSDLLRVLAATESTPERAREEIQLQTLLARALLVTRGFTEEVERAYVRALELCRIAGEIPQMFPVLRGLSTFYALRGELPKSAEIGERILALAERLNDPDMAIQGRVVLGTGVGLTRDLRAGLAHLDRVIADYDPGRARAQRFGFGTNPGVVARVISGLMLWMMGYPETAAARADDAIALARELEHPFSLCYALHHAGLLRLWLGLPEVAGEAARELVAVAEEYGFPIWSAVGTCLRGAALAASGAAGEGVALLERGTQAYRELRSPPIFLPLLLQMQAAAYGAAARPADGLPLIDEVLRVALEASNAIQAAEMLGVKSDLLLAVSPANAAEAEACLEEALRLLRDTQMPMLALRAATRLARLWQAQGKTAAARDVLAGAYGKIAEGYALPDLVQAQALLAELTPPARPNPPALPWGEGFVVSA